MKIVTTYLDYLIVIFICGLTFVLGAAPNLQPTSTPSSLYVAPSVPEDISSNIVDRTSSPTILSDNKDTKHIIGKGEVLYPQEKNEDLDSMNYFFLMVIMFIALVFGIFMFRR